MLHGKHDKPAAREINTRVRVARSVAQEAVGVNHGQDPGQCLRAGQRRAFNRLRLDVFHERSKTQRTHKRATYALEHRVSVGLRVRPHAVVVRQPRGLSVLRRHIRLDRVVYPQHQLVLWHCHTVICGLCTRRELRRRGIEPHAVALSDGEWARRLRDLQ